MKQVIVISLILSSVFMFGQETNTNDSNSQNNKFLIGVNYSADIGYRTLNTSSSEQINSMIIDHRNSTEQPSYGYTTGLKTKYNFSQHFGIEFGVDYSNKGYSTKESELIFGDIIDPRRGFSSQDNAIPSSSKIDYNYHYFDIPIRAVFSLGNNKIHFISSVGFATNILINVTQTVTLKYPDNTEKNNQDITNDFKKLNISPLISAGIGYDISKKINLNLEPTFRYGILNTTDTPITENLWSVGLNITCYYVLQ